MEVKEVVKKELVTRFPTEDFSWIVNLALEDDEEGKDKADHGCNTPTRLFN